MVTINDLYDGLILNCSPSLKFNEIHLYEIKSLKNGFLYSKIHKDTYNGYPAIKILDFINSGSWSIYKPIFELW